MEFTIRTHTGHGAPEDAIESLWPQLQATSFEDAAFSLGRDEIRATWGYDEASRAIQEELVEPRRRVVLEVVCEACDSAAGLDSDWYAISPVN
jgi:hypothetical protein